MIQVSLFHHFREHQPGPEIPGQLNAGDNGELGPVEVVLQCWGLALRRPSTHPDGSFAKSGLVDEDDDSALFRSVFLKPTSAFASSA
jgi:hypothetical protein